jgi:hypothetical protein
MKTGSEVIREYPLNSPGDSSSDSSIDWTTQHNLRVEFLFREIACQLADLNEGVRGLISSQASALEEIRANQGGGDADAGWR